MGLRLAGGGQMSVPASDLGQGDDQAKELCSSQLLLWTKVIPVWQ